MKKINVLVIGGGAREHALAWKLMQSPQCGMIYVAPGNPGTAMLGCQNISIPLTKENFSILAKLARSLNIGLVVVGPENALADGIVQAFITEGIPVFGPVDATIESSKIFAKLLMERAGIPTAPFVTFTNADVAKAYVRSKSGIVVVKADGLALGKGVRVCHSVQEAETAIDDFMVKRILGHAGLKVVIEKLLTGTELAIHALCDCYGHVKLFPPVRDHKHLQNGNKGPMTGSMGAYGPIEVEPGLIARIKQEIVLPCIKELKENGPPFVGCLYIGLMLTADGPTVLEFNARFGAPETEVFMLLLEDDVDLIEVFLACIHGRLDEVELRWKREKCICITLAAEGYPDNPRKGDVITTGGFPWEQGRNKYKGKYLFHAGTAWSNNDLVTNGGRVFSFTTLLGPDTNIDDAYFSIEGLAMFKGMQFRTDIGRS